jgi:hypothetical protein
MRAATAAAPATPAAELQIAITPDPGERGRKVIIVNGERWGTIHMQSAGANGSYWWFGQEGIHGEIRREIKSALKGALLRYVPVQVWGDKVAMRQAGISRHPIGKAAQAAFDASPKIDDRLMTETKALIAEGLLRHPDVVKAARRESAERRVAERAEAERREADEFEARAAEAIGQLHHNDPDARAALIAEVIKAMRWAQTK